MMKLKTQLSNQQSQYRQKYINILLLLKKKKSLINKILEENALMALQRKERHDIFSLSHCFNLFSYITILRNVLNILLYSYYDIVVNFL